VGIGRIDGREVEFDSVSSGELVGGEQGFAGIAFTIVKKERTTTGRGLFCTTSKSRATQCL
jgi:hypothetical protein